MEDQTLTEVEDGVIPGWAQFLIVAMSLQAVLGIIAIEYAFSRLERMKNVDEERDSQFPAFRRRDAAKWSKWKFYPGCIFSMPYRLLLLNLMGVELNLLTQLVMCCKKRQLKQGTRKRCINCLYRSNARLWMCVGGIRSKKIKKDFDYSFYLGPDY